ncbi:MAG: class I SAM-dependent methyltransferase [Thermoleophilia bacterium]|nr:class I SAM-dependent methyltransferase [Thermoleophilia bacterium]
MGARALTHPLADVFACPRCGTTGSGGDDETIVCTQGHAFPVRAGIPRFVEALAGGAGQVQRVFDFEHRRYRDSAYTRFGPELVDRFLVELGLPAEFFAGKRALDAGCGSGRWTYALAELGAKVTGVDLTAGGPEAAHAELGERANVSFAQADLFALPFRAGAFDFVLSWGVLHHTPDTRAAFDRLVPLVRPGGTLFVMVYELESRVRAVGTEVLRSVLRRLPDERRYRACRLLVTRNPWVYRLLGPLFILSYLGPDATVDERTAQFGLFDAYSPRWNHLHTVDDVRGWFGDRGFEDVVAVEAPGAAVRVRGRRPE